MTVPGISEVVVDEPIIKSGSDSLLAALPAVMCVVGLATCLVGSIFRLDTLFFRSGKTSKNSVGRPPRGVTEGGDPIFTDPDGKVVEWPDRSKKAKSATRGQSVVVE